MKSSTILAFAASVALAVGLSAFSATLSPSTIHDAIPGNATIDEIVSAAGGGVNENVVRSLINSEVGGTNAVIATVSNVTANAESWSAKATTNYVNELVAQSTPGDYYNVSNNSYASMAVLASGTSGWNTVHYVLELPEASEECTGKLYQISSLVATNSARFYRCVIDTSSMMRTLNAAYIVGGIAYFEKVPTTTSEFYTLYNDFDMEEEARVVDYPDNFVLIQRYSDTKSKVRTSNSAFQDIKDNTAFGYSYRNTYKWEEVGRPDLSGYQLVSERVDSSWGEEGSAENYPSTLGVSLYTDGRLAPYASTNFVETATSLKQDSFIAGRRLDFSVTTNDWYEWTYINDSKVKFYSTTNTATFADQAKMYESVDAKTNAYTFYVMQSNGRAILYRASDGLAASKIARNPTLYKTALVRSVLNVSDSDLATKSYADSYANQAPNYGNVSNAAMSAKATLDEKADSWSNKQDKLPYETNSIPFSVVTDFPESKFVFTTNTAFNARTGYGYGIRFDNPTEQSPASVFVKINSAAWQKVIEYGTDGGQGGSFYGYWYYPYWYMLCSRDEGESTYESLPDYLASTKWHGDDKSFDDYGITNKLSSTPLVGVSYDFQNGTNFTKRLYEVLTNVIERMGGSIANPPSFD